MKRVLFPALILLLALQLPGCSKSSDPINNGSNNNNNNSGGSATSVSINYSAFGPSSLTVKVGATVTWTNDDNMTHTATANAGSFDTGDIAPGASKSVTFTTAGSFPYHCIYHNGMTGTIVVSN